MISPDPCSLRRCIADVQYILPPLQDNGSIISFSGRICAADLCTHTCRSFSSCSSYSGVKCYTNRHLQFRASIKCRELLSNENRMRCETFNIHIDPWVNRVAPSCTDLEHVNWLCQWCGDTAQVEMTKKRKVKEKKTVCFGQKKKSICKEILNMRGLSFSVILCFKKPVYSPVKLIKGKLELLHRSKYLCTSTCSLIISRFTFWLQNVQYINIAYKICLWSID